MNSEIVKLVGVAAFSLLISACGGGGESDAAAVDSPTPTPTPTAFNISNCTPVNAGVGGDGTDKKYMTCLAGTYSGTDFVTKKSCSLTYLNADSEYVYKLGDAVYTVAAGTLKGIGLGDTGTFYGYSPSSSAMFDIMILTTAQTNMVPIAGKPFVYDDYGLNIFMSGSDVPVVDAGYGHKYIRFQRNRIYSPAGREQVDSYCVMGT